MTVGAAVAALVLAGAPAGFREAPALEPAASFLAGKPVGVWCGVTRLGERYPIGYARSGGDAVFVMPSLVCAPLERLRADVPVPSDDAGYALSVLLHEAAHARGIADERAADCAALAHEAEVGIRFFGLRGKRAYLRSMMATARRSHDGADARYGGSCG